MLDAPRPLAEIPLTAKLGGSVPLRVISRLLVPVVSTATILIPFWLPLVAIGFEPRTVVAVVLVNLAVQFFIHTQVIRKLGWLETVLNTPSHHRVHHAKNPEYIEHNFGGTLIVWDKLFGTFVPEQESIECQYGIPRPIKSHNPIALTFHEWRDMLRDALMHGKSLPQRLGHLWRHPEWQPPSRETK